MVDLSDPIFRSIVKNMNLQLHIWIFNNRGVELFTDD
jgi:hypothetical protein